jgi:phosphoglycolate phosphatase
MEKQDNIKAIIFDLDGTLLNMHDRYAASYIKAFEEMQVSGMNIDPKEIIQMRRAGMSGLEIIKRIAPDIDEEALIKVDESRRRMVEETSLLDTDYPISGLERLLENLKKENIKLAILTLRKERSDVQRQLEKFLLLHYFDRIVVTEEKYNGLMEILDEFGVKAEDTILVGDTEDDIKAGYKAGVATVGVLSGLSGRSVLEKENPSLILDDITKLKLG